ncbi:MAG: flagellar assembly protein FliW [Holophagales bacterium]|nr:flagellar assembly protein FliW [Holophagales bacterium]
MANDEVIIHFPAGLVGFPEAKDFYLFEPDDAYPLKFLQSVNNTQLSFVAMDIAAVKMDFNAPLKPEEVETLELTQPEDALVMAFVIIPEDKPNEMVANLAGPIVVNKINKKAIQLVLDTEEYPLQHPVFDISVHFPAGLIGFPELKRFRLFEPSGAYPFKFLQAIQQEEYSFVCIDIGAIQPEYEAPLSEDDSAFLAAESHDDVIMMALVVIPEDLRQMTANLAGPLVINKHTLKGRQLALDAEKFPLKYQILRGEN